MESLIIAAHIIMAVVITALILLQQGKGASMGVTFGGGASQTILGAAGRTSLLVKITAVLMALFFVSSFMLTMWSRGELRIDPDLLEGLPAVQQAEQSEQGEDETQVPEIPQVPDSQE